MSLVSAFETRININVVEGLVKLGHYEKEGLALALGTSAWNVAILSPYASMQQTNAGSTVKKRLAINRDITAIETARFEDGVDVVLIGTSTNLLAYNVENNADIFYKDVPDGVNCLLYCDELRHISKKGSKQPLVLVGGNCSIQAFDEYGDEVFWTVTSDNVTSLILCDIDNDGSYELLVGSEDCTIKAFKGEQVIFSITESDVITHLYSLGNDCFAYGLKNGTIGVYIGHTKAWKTQNKERVTAMTMFDVSADNMRLDCLMVGWSNGLVEARKIDSGTVLWRHFVVDGTDSDDKVVGLVCGDLRGQECNNQLITVSAKGMISAWIPKPKSPPKPDPKLVGKKPKLERASSFGQTLRQSFRRTLTTRSHDTASSSGGSRDSQSLSQLNASKSLEMQLATVDELDEYEQLSRERDTLRDELEYLSANWKNLKQNNVNDPSLIPTNTEISCTLTPSVERKSLLLIMNTNNATVIKAAVIYGDKVFENGSFMLCPSDSKSTITLPLKFEKDLQCTLAIKAMVGHLSSKQNHVFELSHSIPKFASYLYVASNNIPSGKKPTSFVRFVISERMNRLILWINQAFLLEFESNAKKRMDISFISLRNGQYMTLQVEQGNVKFYTEDVGLAGDIVQDVCQYLSITELQSECYFEDTFQQLRDHLNALQQFNEIRNMLSIDIAANTAVIKNLMVKAEDARIQRNYTHFRKNFSELFEVNQGMLAEFMKRQNNHKNLINALKNVNQTIEKMARCRVGEPQSKIISLARDAVKKNNIDALVNVLHSGAPSTNS
mmetsp:Transcript_5219/g.8620  ORF Transcript_5219/g.8620 Transcript_5219/m.8620 type:complete len:782 (+) Transcript_5219:26-2371(+)